MKKEKGKIFIFSLGGSLIVPQEIDIKFLKKFRNFVLNLIKGGHKIVIVAGGGGVSRKYNQAAKSVSRRTKIKDVDLDWLGIAATKLNAELLRVIFSQYACPKVIVDPNRPSNQITNQLIIASGWKPGSSTDKVAVLWAKKLGAKQIINLTNIDYAYTKDPRKFLDVKPIKKITWTNYRKIIGNNKWSPRLSTPFDPIASKLAQKYKLKVIILNGQKINNLSNYLKGEKFKGTIIE
ncbi:MAG: UMP kinase [Patescibacteria group bacterium]